MPENSPIKAEVEWILEKLAKIKTEKERLKSNMAVANMTIKKGIENIKNEIKLEKKEHEEEKKRHKQEKKILKQKNRELLQAIEDFREEIGTGNSDTKSKFGEYKLQPSQETSAKKNDLFLLGVNEEKIKDLEEKNEEIKIDLQVHRDENKKLLRELLETQGQLAAIETKYDIAHIDQKLESYEKENSELNEKNMSLMDDLFKVKGELERFISRQKTNGRFHNDKIYQLQKENKILKNEIQNKNMINDFEPIKMSTQLPSTFKEPTVKNIASLQQNIGTLLSFLK